MNEDNLARIENLLRRNINKDKQYVLQNLYNETEIGLRNEKSIGHIKLHDNGNITSFSGKSLGTMINNKQYTITNFSKGNNIRTENMNIQCNDTGFNLNSYYMNSDFYRLCKESKEDLSVHCRVKLGKQYVNTIIKPFKTEKLYENNEYNSLLNKEFMV